MQSPIALLMTTGLVMLPILLQVQRATPRARTTHLGFDRNDYPGDKTLVALHRSFAFVGYWLNNPPGASSNSWTGKRKTIEDAGFGFLVLFNGRTDVLIKAAGDATNLGKADAAAAVAAARAEGFPTHAVLFLDQEEGGRLLPEQRA